MPSTSSSRDATALRVVSWNVNGRRDVPRQMALLDALGWDIALLQEVRPQRLAAFRAHRGVGAAALARMRSEAPWACAVLVREGVTLLASGTMVNVPSPERALCAVVQIGEAVLEVQALALPPASSGWKALKGVQADAFGDRWAARAWPVVAGIDRNAPKVDHPELDKVEWFWDAEARVFGPTPKHDLRDVLRTYLDAHPSERATLAAQRPTGPLATSFMRGRGRGDTPARYDAIYASPELEVRAVQYPWEASLEAGSDHGLVWAELRLLSRAERIGA